MKVTYFTIKICRQLSQDKENIKKLQGNNIRLTEKLIIAFKWLDKKIANDQIPLRATNESATATKESIKPAAEGEEAGEVHRQH